MQILRAHQAGDLVEAVTADFGAVIIHTEEHLQILAEWIAAGGVVEAAPDGQAAQVGPTETEAEAE